MNYWICLHYLECYLDFSNYWPIRSKHCLMTQNQRYFRWRFESLLPRFQFLLVGNFAHHNVDRCHYRPKSYKIWHWTLIHNRLYNNVFESTRIFKNVLPYFDWVSLFYSKLGVVYDCLGTLKFLFFQNANHLLPPYMYLCHVYRKEHYSWTLLAMLYCPSNYTYCHYRRQQNGGDGQHVARKWMKLSCFDSI